MEVVSARFKETTDPDKDWLSGERRFECDANGAENLKKYICKQYDSSIQGLSDHLSVQWKAHGRIYRATFGLGLLCDLHNARLVYENGTVKLTLPPAEGCVPEEING